MITTASRRVVRALTATAAGVAVLLAAATIPALNVRPDHECVVSHSLAIVVDDSSLLCHLVYG